MTKTNPAKAECGTVASILFWTVWVFFTLFYTITSILFFSWIYLLSRKTCEKIFHQVAVMWAKSIIYTVQIWKITSTAEGKPKHGQNYLIIANHQSLLDILVALVILPIPFKFMAKSSLFKIPFLGWHMFFAGYIPVERGSAESRKYAVQTAKQRILEGESILMFPEGTRSLDGQMLPFKPGAFKLAQNEHTPLLPLVIHGTSEGVRKKNWRVSRVHIKTLLKKPLLLADDEESVAVKIQEVRDAMIQSLAGLRAIK